MQWVCNLCIRKCAGEPCSRASLLMLGSMTLMYIVLFLPQLKTCLALYPAVRFVTAKAKCCDALCSALTPCEG